MKAYRVSVDGRILEVGLERAGPRQFSLLIDGKSHSAKVMGALIPSRQTTLTFDGADCQIKVERSPGSLYTVSFEDRDFQVRVEGGDLAKELEAAPPLTAKAAPRPSARMPTEAGAITAPMPGRIVSVRVRKGDTVKAGDPLLLIEAMKMENEIMSPRDGVVADVRVVEGVTVARGDALVILR